MNWQHLLYFLTVAKYENYTLAANELFVDTSTLSKAIANLETHLEVPLFHKSGRHIQLTKFGQLLYYHVRNGAREMEKGIQTIETLADSKRGTVDLGTIFSITNYYLPNLLIKLRETYPDLTINLSQTSTQYVYEGVLNGQLDFGICGEFSAFSGQRDIQHQLLLQEDIMLIVPDNHYLADFDAVTFEEIQGEDFIGCNRQTGLQRNILDTIELVTGQPPAINIVYEVNEEHSITGLVRAGLGIALIPNIPSLNLSGIKTLTVTDLPVIRNIYLIWNQTITPTHAATTFKEQLLQYNRQFTAKKG